jgi:Carboxypeptidase regulatory-like domain
VQLVRRVLSAACLVLTGATVAFADIAPADQAQVTVTVLDQTGAALVLASVTLVDAAGTPITRPVDQRGQARFEKLAPGSYQLKADAVSFQSYDAPLKVKKGANQLTLKLPLAGLNEQVIVTTQDSDVRGNGFVTQLSEQEIAELPDDPDELQQVLEQMAGPGATFRVNGFTGGRLPPKSQIRQIRFRMNSFDAEYHEGGGFGIDIITKPGMDGWKGVTNFGFRDESLNARNAFAPTLAPEQHRRFGFNADGPIVKGKTSMAISLEGNDSYDSETINALTPDGRVEGSVRNPEKRMFGSVRLDHSLTKNQQMLVEFQCNTDERDNLGVGDFDLPDRAYRRQITNNALRIGMNGLIAPKVAHELRVRFESGSTTTASVSSDPAVIVLDNFSSGGAGQNGDRRNKTLEVADNIDWSFGKKHAFRAGMLAEQYWYNSSDLTNFNGTFTFGGLQQYEVALPTTFTQRTGSADVDYTFFTFGWFVQDTWTLSKKLSASLGLRQEVQSHLSDKNNVMPRLGATWAPGKFTVRGGYGIFYDWYESSYYEQVLRVNGVTQQETVIRFPGYPDPTGGQIADPLPPSRIEEAAGLRMPYVHQASIGVERTFIETLRIQATYLMQRGADQFRSVNVNAPIDGVRPDESLGNVTELQSTGTTKVDRLMVNVNYAIPQKRFFMGGNYQFGRVKNFTDNPFSLPADNYDLDAEWGPSMRDIRHRFFAMVNFGLPRNVRMALFTQGSSAAPYNLITGFDLNGDTLISDRPAGVTRNTARGAAQWNVNLRLSKTFSFGPQTTSDGPRVIRGGGGGGRGGPGGPGGGGPMMMAMDGNTQRYRMEFYAQAFNLLNRTNFLNFVGNERSPFFGTATSASAARRIEVGINFGF